MNLLPPEKECLRLQIESAAGHGCVEEYGLSVRATMPGHSHHDPEASLEPTPDNERVIDREGFRPNVGIVVCNDRDQVLWGRRINGRDSWQFPQGGIDEGETPEEALYRELYEETGLERDKIEILDKSKKWLVYHIPHVFQRSKKRYDGAMQKWFLLKITGSDSDVNLNATGHAEFDAWKWGDKKTAIKSVIKFKRKVYESILDEFSETLERLEYN